MQASVPDVRRIGGIADGRVTIDGRVAEVGQKLMPGQRVACDGVAVSGKDAPVLLAVNKPRGMSARLLIKIGQKTSVEFLDYPVRIYPIGRLDKDSEGLLLMTNEGELVNRILRARYGHEKEYLVTVDKPIDSEFVRKMSAGVKILDTVTRPCEVEKTGKYAFADHPDPGTQPPDPPDVRGAGVPGADVKTRPDAEHYAGWAENRRVPGSDSGRETEIRRYFERKEEWLRQCCLAVRAGSHMRLHRNA